MNIQDKLPWERKVFVVRKNSYYMAPKAGVITITLKLRKSNDICRECAI